MKKIFCIILFLLISATVSFAQEKTKQNGWQVEWYSSLRGAGGIGEYMPFWARTGEDGILPVRSSGLLTAGADLSYRHTNGFFFETGTNLAGVLSAKSPLNPSIAYGFVDRLYLSVGWKMLRLDVGMKPRKGELGSLSISGGDFIQSSNARAIPGFNISSDWIYFEKGHWFGIRGNFAHYHTIDNRMVKGAMIHNKSVALKFALGRKVDLIAGFDHYALWGGYSERLGQQPQSFRDFIKVFFALRGDSDDSVSSQLNAFGNHLGREWARIVWRAKPFTMTFQYDKPFEDNSGIKFRNFPDGVWSLQFALADRKAFVTDVTYEFINTTWQSGDLHDRPATEEEKAEQDPSHPTYGKVVLGGRDDYFSTSPYSSGWSYYGRIIGLPLILPRTPNEDGIITGIVNNRVRGHHLGIGGVISQKVPYRFKATYTDNFGRYAQPYPEVPWQLSLAFEVEVDSDVLRLPLSLSVGLYGDVGKLYHNSIGLTLRLTYKDLFRF